MLYYANISWIQRPLWPASICLRCDVMMMMMMMMWCDLLMVTCISIVQYDAFNNNSKRLRLKFMDYYLFVRLLVSVSLFCQLCVARGPHKGTQTDDSQFTSLCTTNGMSSVQADGVLPECSCDAKTVFNDLKDQLKREHDEDKNSALKSLEERVGTCDDVVFCFICHFIHMCSCCSIIHCWLQIVTS